MVATTADEECSAGFRDGARGQTGIDRARRVGCVGVLRELTHIS